MRRMNFGEAITLVAIKAAALESKSSVLVHFVTLRALNIRKGRMLVKRRESGGWRGAREKTDFFLTAIPGERKSMSARTQLDNGVKHVRKRLLRLDRLTV